MLLLTCVNVSVLFLLFPLTVLIESILTCYKIFSALFHADTSGNAVEEPLNPLQSCVVFLSELSPRPQFFNYYNFLISTLIPLLISSYVERKATTRRSKTGTSSCGRTPNSHAYLEAVKEIIRFGGRNCVLRPAEGILGL